MHARRYLFIHLMFHITKDIFVKWKLLIVLLGKTISFPCETDNDGQIFVIRLQSITRISKHMYLVLGLVIANLESILENLILILELLVLLSKDTQIRFYWWLVSWLLYPSVHSILILDHISYIALSSSW